MAMTGALAALIFAAVGCVVIDRWIQPGVMAQFAELAAQGVPATAPAHPLLVMSRPHLTLAAGQLVASLCLLHPRLERLPMAAQLALIVAATSASTVGALAAFAPPGIVSWLLFAVPAGLLLALCWAIAGAVVFGVTRSRS
jgi:hypothetical protein